MTDEFQTEELLLLLKKINIDMETRLDRKLKKQDVSGTQVYFLAYILRHHPNGTYITQLCREIGVSKATMSTLVKKLREKGYLYFLEDPKDIRKKMVFPTEQLKDKREELLAQVQQMENEICRVLNLKEKKQLRELEQKILLGLKKDEEVTP